MKKLSTCESRVTRSCETALHALGDFTNLLSAPINPLEGDVMNAQQTTARFFHRPVRVSVKFSNSRRQIVGFIEDEEDFDGLESELKRMIELSGMVKPQYEPVVIESWD